MEVLNRLEHVARIGSNRIPSDWRGVGFESLVSAHCGSRGVSTAIATFTDGGLLPYHSHPFSEAVVLLSGELEFYVEGRLYLLQQYDCAHIPAGVAHSARLRGAGPAVAISAFANEIPERTMVDSEFKPSVRGLGRPQCGDPESLVRFNDAPEYELAEGALFRDLFAGRLGSTGICGGIGRFRPGSSLPCHFHHYDESITIVNGSAVCQVEGRKYSVANCDTVLVPEGRLHRFLNHSSSIMTMFWVYAGSEPKRTVVDNACCSS
jgi:quercetin dioxygenase-like cupin family protein